MLKYFETKTSIIVSFTLSIIISNPIVNYYFSVIIELPCTLYSVGPYGNFLKIKYIWTVMVQILNLSQFLYLVNDKLLLYTVCLLLTKKMNSYIPSPTNFWECHFLLWTFWLIAYMKESLKGKYSCGLIKNMAVALEHCKTGLTQPCYVIELQVCVPSCIFGTLSFFFFLLRKYSSIS